MTLTLRDRIVERALSLGFARVGFVPVAPVTHAEQFEKWLADGFHGEMAWMEKHRELRLGHSPLEPSLRTAICVSAPYGSPEARTVGGDPISLYAQGVDYHEVLRGKLRQLGAFVTAETGSSILPRPAVDSAPVLERDLACQAGLGWIGKSAMLIDREWGTYTFLGELFVDVELPATEVTQPDRCGRCTKCVDLCPTGAIVAGRRVDARRCISYLTIELRGPIPRELRPLMGTHLFGCDICQAVCPWNRHARGAPMPELVPKPEIAALTARTILRLTEVEFKSRFRGTALSRARRSGLARNACVVLGNNGDLADVPLLIETLTSDPLPLVRGHAAWALGRFPGSAGDAALSVQFQRESDCSVQEEIRAAIATGS